MNKLEMSHEWNFICNIINNHNLIDNFSTNSTTT